MCSEKCALYEAGYFTKRLYSREETLSKFDWNEKE